MRRGVSPTWTAENRPRYDRGKLRYPSDLTDKEWALVEPVIPPAKRGGRKREVDVRKVVNGIMYVLSTGCQWRYVPKDLPPKSTRHDYLDLWNYDGTLETIHHELYVKCRKKIGRDASPTACVIDSQSVKSAGKRGVCIDSHGYDAGSRRNFVPAAARRSGASPIGKKIKGKKRHILVDTVGLLLHAIVHPADIQYRDGGVLVLTALFGLFPFLRRLFADGGYRGPQFQGAVAKALPHLMIEIVKRSDQARGFEVLPKRWVVERTPEPAEGGLAQSLPSAGQGFREPHLQRRRVHPPRLNPPHATKTLQSRLNFPD